ncbi:zinc ribbon domain-containing protein [Papillibacter cinnamivorans]|uniref:Zinc-ribbon family protein n=1 Tax=Papillibacter cinnamivorans DSM 12816 TaxID=1122930 RepID=A0A1W2CZX7_9FIRM|nr:zinc ribbon domain-containing protein [Papillibacter cinnamivorans]SMC90288.1 zinc-ribbon family protein [Papillibacter cinnamivorans DSM 12816]
MFFFISGISERSKELGRTTNLICPACGEYTSMTVSVFYKVLHIFFIPIFRWDRHYFATASCCGAVFEIDPEEGRKFESGAAQSIDPRYMHRTGNYSQTEVCAYCGEPLVPGALFCHRCGRPVS